MSSFAYSAANIFPLKVLLHQQLENTIRLEGKIVPVHVQLNPTNRCNFSCGFCSCSERDKTVEMPLEKMIDCMKTARNLGCQSVTITGGGEPTIHRNFKEMVEKLRGLGLQLGLVTNGSLVGQFPSRFFDNFVWVRVSSGDHLEKQLNRLDLNVDLWLNNIQLASENSMADWAFSYVAGTKINYELIAKLVKFANMLKFSHVRIVNDILNAEKQKLTMKMIRGHLDMNRVDDKLVNYQSRSSYTRGTNPCYISLLKPVISADGKIFPCCGCQYALENPSRDYEKSMCMGSVDELEKIYDEQSFFDGSVCKKCYYSGYNVVLHHMLHGIAHAAFV